MKWPSGPLSLGEQFRGRIAQAQARVAMISRAPDIPPARYGNAFDSPHEDSCQIHLDQCFLGSFRSTIALDDRRLKRRPRSFAIFSRMSPARLLSSRW